MAEASSSKRACVDAAGDDRLSALPDALLYSVMSFLTARQAVQTSALSRRWRDLWYSMPCLDIDHREFQTVPGVTGCRYPDNCFVWWKLENFTANLLMYHRAPVLDSFRLRVGGLHVDQEVDRWVRRGVRYRPVVLEITMASTQQKLRLPPLGPAPRMKRLQLCRVRLDGGFAGHLRSQCPVLEELELKDCDCDFQEIASATLKRLAIEGSRRVYDDGDLPFSVAAPALASLRLGFPQCTDPDVLLVNGGAEFLLQASISGCCEFIGKYLFGLLGRLCNLGHRLRLEPDCLRHRVEEQRRRCVRIMAPSLASLCLFVGWSPYWDGVFLAEADSLVRVSVIVGEACKFDPMSTKSLHELLAKLVNLRALKLSSFLEVEPLFVDDERRGDFSNFHKLTTLELEECDMNEVFRILPSILHSAPCLEIVLRCNTASFHTVPRGKEEPSPRGSLSNTGASQFPSRRTSKLYKSGVKRMIYVNSWNFLAALGGDYRRLPL
ncbi:hypothetical protein BAE44_0017993 [Dichanthelium oligosanthes]|uniref:F-box domain-containing protein n=1 Tax=Dichanthelium oligosanthes TaxID=888268 RepID=A0A1E5V768_9POAL|nr:hypothetical protein BAE44_0017993 [Dichanthelium oligosanthes]